MKNFGKKTLSKLKSSRVANNSTDVIGRTGSTITTRKPNISMTRLPKLEKIKPGRSTRNNTKPMPKEFSSKSHNKTKYSGNSVVDEVGIMSKPPRRRKNKLYANVNSSGYGSFGVHNQINNSNSKGKRSSKRTSKKDSEDKKPYKKSEGSRTRLPPIK